MGLCSSSNVKHPSSNPLWAHESNVNYQTNNPALEITCPEGALPVQPGLNSLKNAVKEAKEKDIGCLFLLSGMHNEEGEEVDIDFALKVVGQNRDDVKIKGSLVITGQKEEDVFLSDCTVTGAEGNGVCCGGDAASHIRRKNAIHLKNVCVEQCGYNGVSVWSTKRNTMTDCNVNNNKNSGVYVGHGGCMIIDGSATTIHHNATGGDSFSFGLCAEESSDSIHLKSLTKESISTNNGGGEYQKAGCNYSGDIKTI